MDSLIATLSAWIALQIGMAAPPAPQVIHLDPAVMNDMARGTDIQFAFQVRALYGRGDRTVYLRTNWDAAKLADRSELVHELVHHFQTAHALPYDCSAARERLAYELQVKWLREQGVENPYDLLQINEFFMIMASVCRDADHD